MGSPKLLRHLLHILDLNLVTLKKQLGDEYFIPAHTLLYEQGVKLQTLDVERLDGFPIFFKTQGESFFSFDIFAATFFLLTRYEEALPHIKTPQGFFDPAQSIAGQYDFLDTSRSRSLG